MLTTATPEHCLEIRKSLFDRHLAPLTRKPGPPSRISLNLCSFGSFNSLIGVLELLNFFNGFLKFLEFLLVP